MTDRRAGMGARAGRRGEGTGSAPPTRVPPLSLTAPVASGTPAVGEELSCTTGTWLAVPAAAYAYQWKRDGASINGATASAYTLIGADSGTIVRCDVTATNAIGSATAQSNGLAIA